MASKKSPKSKTTSKSKTPAIKGIIARPQNKADYDNNGRVAQAEFENMLEGMSPTQKKAVMQVCVWLSKYFMSTGYKRLGRTLIYNNEARAAIKAAKGQKS